MAEIKTLRIDSTEVKVKSSESVLPTEYNITNGKMYCDVINTATISTDDVTLALEGLKDVTTSITDKHPEYHAILIVSKERTVTLPVGTKIKTNDEDVIEISTTATNSFKVKDSVTDPQKLELSIQNGLCFVFVWGGVAPFSGLTFTAVEGGSTISGAISGTLTYPIYLQYSTDGENWNTFLQGTKGSAAEITLTNAEDKVYIKNNNNTLSNSGVNFFYFTMTGKIEASGNIHSMINNTTLSDRCFAYLFNGCENLVLISSNFLPDTELKEQCYMGMFSGCTGLTSAPKLPAETLASGCYNQMFYGCTGLTSAPALPATTLAISCYNQMFYGCTGLTSAPALPAETLANDCYNYMFSGCTGLKVCNSSTTGATLFFTCPSGITPSGYCYSMFDNTGGSFTGNTPFAGESYYWYTE